MKKLVFATMMCVAAMSAKAQVLTSETINNVYEEVSNQANREFAFNVERIGDAITTMYVYKEDRDCNGAMCLKPYMKYGYSYAADGTLTSRTTYRWNDSQNSWNNAARHDFTLANGQYSAEYSRYNHTTNSFDQPVEKMVYSLLPYEGVNCISYYHRDKPSSQYQLISETIVTPDQPLFFAEK